MEVAAGPRVSALEVTGASEVSASSDLVEVYF